MTISLAWIRRVNTVEELVFASDSRLSFGARWDCCPKIITLPRSDCAISFAGDTAYAYPIMLQLNSAIYQNRILFSRGLDITELKGHLLRILNGMTSAIHSLPKGLDPVPETSFIFGGWSWRQGRFRVWLFHHDAYINEFTFRPVRNWSHNEGGKFLAVTGDLNSEYKENLIKLLKKRNKLTRGGFNMEPFEVLRDMIRSGEHDSIGGAPQVMKLYKYSNTQPYAVIWPNQSEGKASLLGRPLLDYEKTDYMLLDPDTLQTQKHELA